jgi:hypothetical protein
MAKGIPAVRNLLAKTFRNSNGALMHPPCGKRPEMESSNLACVNFTHLRHSIRSVAISLSRGRAGDWKSSLAQPARIQPLIHSFPAARPAEPASDPLAPGSARPMPLRSCMNRESFKCPVLWRRYVSREGPSKVFEWNQPLPLRLRPLRRPAAHIQTGGQSPARLHGLAPIQLRAWVESTTGPCRSSIHRRQDSKAPGALTPSP